MSNSVLDAILQQLESSPHCAKSLTLYALINTLEHETAGCLFKLTKLRDLDREGRQLAYSLMELMAEKKNGGDAWEQASKRMDGLIRRA